jgi:protein-S-isoprenylcysteine O-methyltransferase Ste14
MLYARALFIIGCAWYVIEFFLQGLLVRNQQKTNKDKRTLLLASWLSDIIGIVFGFIYNLHGFLFLGIFSLALSIIGIALISFGAIIRWISIFTLKKYFTVNLKVTKEQKIIDYGIYRYVRHPSYTGLLLSHIGLGLVFCNAISFVFITIPLFIWIIIRIKLEEKMLIETFKNQYLEYMKKTKRLIPFIV